MKNLILTLLLSTTLLYLGCEDPKPDLQPEVIKLDETPYELDYGSLPNPNIPEDNPLTVQGVKLGRMLFYETMLSKNGEQSCASCHLQSFGFSDTARLSIGVEMMEGKRQAMAIFNMAWHTNEFFWDGRSHLLRDQALKPIEDPLEMNEKLENVIKKLKGEQKYLDQFTRAFGTADITKEKMALAMEQFEHTIVSNDSKYDRYLAGTATLSESEERGRKLYFTEYNPFFPEESGADCEHCHGGPNFTNNLYMNNGLDETFLDDGRGIVTKKDEDNGKFKVPSLRNIEMTSPYMHDGRFATLEEVINHYNTGIKESSTVDPALLTTKEKGLFLTTQDKKDLIEFLKTLTDHTYLNKSEYQTPFE